MPGSGVSPGERGQAEGTKFLGHGDPPSLSMLWTCCFSAWTLCKLQSQAALVSFRIHSHSHSHSHRIWACVSPQGLLYSPSLPFYQSLLVSLQTASLPELSLLASHSLPHPLPLGTSSTRLVPRCPVTLLLHPSSQFTAWPPWGIHHTDHCLRPGLPSTSPAVHLQPSPQPLRCWGSRAFVLGPACAPSAPLSLPQPQQPFLGCKPGP